MIAAEPCRPDHGSNSAQLALSSNCELLVSNVFFASPATTNANGAARFTLSIPVDPNLIGFELFSQWIVADPSGALALPGITLALSRGHRHRFGV